MMLSHHLFPGSKKEFNTSYEQLSFLATITRVAYGHSQYSTAIFKFQYLLKKISAAKKEKAAQTAAFIRLQKQIAQSFKH